MRKRWMALLCCVLLILGCACLGTAEEEPAETPYILYFQERELQAAAGSGALRKVGARLTETAGMSDEEIAENLMIELLAGPVDETLKRTIPAGTTLSSLEVEGTRAYVDLSSTYGMLSGVALTLADQSIALTLTQLPGILSVKITVLGQELEYRDKQIFTGRDVLLAPEGDVVSTLETLLYFPDETGQLAAEERKLDLYEGDTQVGVVLRALENGPETKELQPVLPEGFRVRSAWLEESVCYVNLSGHLLESLPENAALEPVLEALGRSFCGLDAVTETRFLVDGEYADDYGGVNIAKPYTE